MLDDVNAPMQAQLQERLDKLKQEFTRGREQLAQTEARAQELRETLLRISGAIQVLEEMLGASTGAPE
jgi:uncharacterized membrane-anchored protein YhcB (DUF1043 family)